MTTAARYTAVAVFPEQASAERAIEELRQAGFPSERIGVTTRHDEPLKEPEDSTGTSTTAETEGAGIGMLVGASLGGLLVGLGQLPVLGAVVAGGLLSGLVGGGVVGGLVGALIGLGVPEEEAHYYQKQLASGHTLVTVNTNGRYSEARAILLRNSGHDADSPLREVGPGRLP